MKATKPFSLFSLVHWVILSTLCVMILGAPLRHAHDYSASHSAFLESSHMPHRGLLRQSPLRLHTTEAEVMWIDVRHSTSSKFANAQTLARRSFGSAFGFSSSSVAHDFSAAQFPYGRVLISRDSNSKDTGKGSGDKHSHTHPTKSSENQSSSTHEKTSLEKDSKVKEESAPKILSGQNEQKFASPIVGGIGNTVKSSLWTGIGLLGNLLDNWSRKRK
ncbi:hypothetical protein IE81DRAFT_199820 [Ceraceosorus guamensis]|uniref:Uncharacterized protein n=1 Tax=Ceraceosorus guamensis TaxID=1522189 RepID=A0A316VXA8_9BASI|nr:hypothetical protein IE81DRAFT_199820 [Ceraceosorus guamensis]PWN40921.1 hypothetical protein IE81DRAFT_199820 [Ceraceosorus guamensis]